MIISVDVEKVFDKNLTSLHDKSPKETRNIRNIVKLKKGCRLQTHRQG
jgi:hypothetical protein